MAGLAPFPVDVRRTAITIAFQNEEFIADMVLPRVPVGGERFSWKRYRLGETYKLQETTVGRTGRPNEVEFGFDEVEATTMDQGLEAPIPQKDINNAPPGYDPVDSHTRMLTEHILLRREKRVADLVATAGNYSLTTTLTGANRFTSATSDPFATIAGALKSMPRRANTMVMSEDTLDVILRHPYVVAAFNGNEGTRGIATPEFLQRIFRIKNLFVGAAWCDSTRMGQATTIGGSLTRLWGDDIALLYLDPSANTQEGITWGMTAQWGNRITMTRPDPDIGLEGGVRVRVGEHVREIIAAPEAGYLLIDAGAPQ